jgi:hypothetical protein
MEERIMTEKSASTMPRWARYTFAGGVAGFVSALAVLFIITVFYGEVLGMGAESCVIFGCAMTAMLSQPAGLFGMALGIIVGAICGALGHHATS